MTGPAQVAWCPLCRRGEYCPDNERLAMLESQKDLAAQLERADQWQTEACQLRARIAELEGRVESLIREHLEHEKEINEMWHNRLIEEAALKLNERARAEKAEARIAELEADCARISTELGLPPGITLADGWFRKWDEQCRAAVARAEAAEANSKRRHELLVDVARAINALGEELVAIPGLVAKVRDERDEALHTAAVRYQRLAPVEALLGNLARSRKRYPQNRRMFDGLMGEIDELRRAYHGDGDITAEALDVAVCALRIALEGDAGGNERLEDAKAERDALRDLNASTFAQLLAGSSAERARAERLAAERDRYLAAIVEAERLAMKGVRDIDDGTWISDIAILLRPIVEEASRG